MKLRGGKVKTFVGAFVVFEIIVIVLRQNQGHRTEIRGVQRAQLLVETAGQGSFVGRAEYRQILIETAVFAPDEFPGSLCGFAVPAPGDGLVPIHLIADAHGEVRIETQGALEHAAPGAYGQIAPDSVLGHRVVRPSGAGVDQHAETLRRCIRRRRGAQRPGFGQRGAPFAQLQFVFPGAFESVGGKRPEAPQRVAGTARNVPRADAQHRILPGVGKGDLEQDGVVTGEWNEMADVAAAPVPGCASAFGCAEATAHQRRSRYDAAISQEFSAVHTSPPPSVGQGQAFGAILTQRPARTNARKNPWFIRRCNSPRSRLSPVRRRDGHTEFWSRPGNSLSLPGRSIPASIFPRTRGR